MGVYTVLIQKDFLKNIKIKVSPQKLERLDEIKLYVNYIIRIEHMFPHTELTLRPCMVSLNEYLARSPPIKFTPLYTKYLHIIKKYVNSYILY